MTLVHPKMAMGSGRLGHDFVHRVLVEMRRLASRDGDDMDPRSSSGEARDRTTAAKHFVIGMRRDHRNFAHRLKIQH